MGRLSSTLDYWGGRVIPDYGPLIPGLSGELLYPVAGYTYTFQNGTDFELQCYEPNGSIPSYVRDTISRRSVANR